MDDNQNNSKQYSRTKMIVGLALLVGFLTITFFIYNDIMVGERNEATFLYLEKESTKSQKTPTEKQRDSIILITRQMVINDNGGRRLAVDFPTNQPPKVVNEKTNRWLVSGVVNLKDDKGAPVRTKYFLSLKANPLCDDYFQMACWTSVDSQYQKGER